MFVLVPPCCKRGPNKTLPEFLVWSVVSFYYFLEGQREPGCVKTTSSSYWGFGVMNYDFHSYIFGFPYKNFTMFKFFMCLPVTIQLLFISIYYLQARSKTLAWSLLSLLYLASYNLMEKKKHTGEIRREDKASDKL